MEVRGGERRKTRGEDQDHREFREELGQQLAVLLLCAELVHFVPRVREQSIVGNDESFLFAAVSCRSDLAHRYHELVDSVHTVGLHW